MSDSDFSKLNAGDLIQVRRTMVVTRQTDNFIFFDDVASQQRFAHRLGVEDTARYELLRKGKPRKGDVIDGETVKATPWRRGTVLLSENIPVLLTGEGLWVEPNCTEGWGFEAILDNDSFTVVHLP